MTQTKGQEGEQCLDALPSNQAYENFKLNGKSHSNNGSVSGIKSDLESALQDKLTTTDCVGEIAGTWFYITQMMRNSDPSYTDRCNFFYNWLGEIVYEKLKETGQFQKTMSDIYTTLDSKFPNDKCKIVDHNLPGISFNHRKTVFDYSYNHGTMENEFLASKAGCAEEYSRYLEKINADYESIKSSCSRQGTKQYCRDLGNIFLDDNSPEKLKAKFDKKIEEERAAKDLPSQKIYNAFDEGRTCTIGTDGQKCNGQKKGDIESTLNSYKYIKDETLARKIVQNWCYIHNKVNSSDVFYKERCHFFYYWLGDKVKDKLPEGHALSTAMNNMHNQLHRFQCKNQCDNPYPDNDSLIIFENGKKLFDYYYNYAALQKGTDCNATSCSSTYEQYLSKAKSAYSTINGICNGNSSGIYCTEFMSKIQEEKIKEPTDFICRSVGKPQSMKEHRIKEKKPKELKTKVKRQEHKIKERKLKVVVLLEASPLLLCLLVELPQ
ncbi:KIR protein [Plasmodium coatneyi]|uniref:KIR protein n=1 Tax=Plasmodium coatneyi TaxID=208452 RepID=A0A1B1DXT9_9APIC|nr:KIR protein [Plasmodium coatneyi]ANQ07427.1 KIR protein [Plasmodium coatneyi]